MSVAKRLARRFAVAVVLFAVCYAPATAAEPDFVTGLNDVPLMPGLSPLGETLVFDKPGGRIAEAVFTGRAAVDAVARFYADTLPQLGWRMQAPGRYVRDHEELALHLTGAGTTTLRLVLQPRR